MATYPTLIFILLLYYITQSTANHVTLNDQLEQPTHIDLLSINTDHDVHQQTIAEHHHRKRHHHGENVLKYYNYCRYIRNENCDNDKCCHIECAKANFDEHDQRSVCRHNCVQHCQNYLIDKYNVKIDVITEHPPTTNGIIELQTEPNVIATDQKLCCFIDIPENCQKIQQYPYVQCEIKRKSTCGQHCLQKVVDINYRPTDQLPIIQQPWPYQFIYNQPQITYPNYYYPQQQSSSCPLHGQIPYYQNSYYQYPYYQNSYYQNPNYQNLYYQNSYYQNPYYQNSYYQNPYYQNSYYQNQYSPNPIYQYYYPSIQPYPIVPQTTTTSPVTTTTENNPGIIGERPRDYQNDGESNDLRNEIVTETKDVLPNENTVGGSN